MAKLNLNGTHLTLAALARIATMLEQDGCIEVVNCLQGAIGIGAMSLGTIVNKVIAELEPTENR